MLIHLAFRVELVVSLNTSVPECTVNLALVLPLSRTWEQRLERPPRPFPILLPCVLTFVPPAAGLSQRQPTARRPRASYRPMKERSMTKLLKLSVRLTSVRLGDDQAVVAHTSNFGRRSRTFPSLSRRSMARSPPILLPLYHASRISSRKRDGRTRSLRRLSGHALTAHTKIW